MSRESQQGTIEDARHVCYEFKQMVGSLQHAEMCRKEHERLLSEAPHTEEAVDNVQLRSNCFITANLVAVRNLICFFDADSNYDDDILHVDFLNGIEMQTDADLSYVRKQRESIHKRLAHLTRARANQWDGWLLSRLARILLEQGMRFVHDVRDLHHEHAVWFDDIGAAQAVFVQDFPPDEPRGQRITTN